MIPPLRILIDSREQACWAWSPSDAVTNIAGLAVGDYALECDTENPKRAGQLRPVRFSLERKSLDDFLGSISTTWENGSIRKTINAASFPARIIIVEGDFHHVCFAEAAEGLIPPEHNHPKLEPAFVARRIAELTMLGVSVLLSGSAELAAGQALHIFRERMRMLEVKP